MPWGRSFLVLALLISQSFTVSAAAHASDLPVTLVPTSAKNDLPMVFYISGDGGWNKFSQSLAQSIAVKGMPVMGLDARKYFWKDTAPEIASAEISAAIAHQMKLWNKKTFVLIGFSYGASIVPFVASRLPPALKKNLLSVIAMSPNERTDFEVRIADMLNIGRRRGEYNVLAEMVKIRPLGLVCFFGHDENIEVETKIEKAGISIVRLPGGHHYEDNYVNLSAKIHEYLVRRSDDSASRLYRNKKR